MKAINYIKEKFSNLLKISERHRNSFYVGTFVALIFGSILFFQSSVHELETLKQKKENLILRQHLDDSIILLGSQKQIISNQEKGLGTASQIIQEQNAFIQKAIERIQKLESLFVDPDKWI